MNGALVAPAPGLFFLVVNGCILNREWCELQIEINN